MLQTVVLFLFLSFQLSQSLIGLILLVELLSLISIYFIYMSVPISYLLLVLIFFIIEAVMGLFIVLMVSAQAGSARINIFTW